MSQKKSCQKYKNTFAFKHNPGSAKTAKILALPNEGLCNKCHSIIEWRKKYRKYKPLTTPRRCSHCEQKTVRRAYHNLCEGCSQKLGVCAKCRANASIVNPILTKEQEKEDRALVKDAMSRMSEREKRAFLRQVSIIGDEEDDEEDAPAATEEMIDIVKAANIIRKQRAASSSSSPSPSSSLAPAEQGSSGDQKEDEKPKPDSEKTTAPILKEEEEFDDEDGGYEDDDEEEEDEEEGEDPPLA
eukprot:TRINITY_DN1781_c3_g1_i1.p1 TRINITY_DN1781_c3_g1~~TRINITY_DN1781_c3_g1_i1.p1  ORF type:complete len:243 (-),score=95.10 TRINITY_DN1781_c3_g1_i1:74-802(-)